MEKRISGGSEFFENHMTGDRMTDAMFRYAASLDCDLVDIVVNDKNECPLGVLDVTDWFSTLIAYRSITYSGVLCPRSRSGK